MIHRETSINSWLNDQKNRLLDQEILIKSTVIELIGWLYLLRCEMFRKYSKTVERKLLGFSG